MNLLERANKVYLENFPPTTWFGRCIFLSWYCDLGTCKFCFRSTIKHKIQYAKNAKRSKASIIADAVFGKNLGWELEFLTGGYRIFSFGEMKEIIKIISEVYQKKIWINLGVLNEDQLNELHPYVEGICASIETVNKTLHDKVCPDKKMEPYLDMLKLAKKKNFKTSMTIVLGLGETKDDFTELSNIIKDYKLDCITFYALKPIPGTVFKESPDIDYYTWWVAQTRINFPKLRIITGLTPKHPEYAELLLKAGSNALTKFPVVKKFNSEDSKLIELQIKNAGRTLQGSLTKLPNIDWEKEVNRLSIDPELKNKILLKLKEEYP
jgi:biotin synthase-like enzyme